MKPHPVNPLARTGALVGLILVLALGGSGCRILRTTAQLPGRAVGTVMPGKSDKSGPDPVELQQTLQRFADECSGGLISGLERLQRGTNALSPSDLLRWKINIETAISGIVTGPNAFANAVDMAMFVAAARLAVEQHWQPKIFGASALPLLESCRAAESNIWQLVGSFLTPEQLVELREAVTVWYQENPLLGDVVSLRAVEFGSRLTHRKAVEQRARSVFGFLNLDPLGGLDPAMRELAQTRLMAERALYLAHRLPTLLRWQTELLAMNTTELPAVGQFLTNTTEVTATVARLTAVAEKLPAQVSAEREQILLALRSQEKELGALAAEVRQTLQAGSQMSTSLNVTLTTFDALLQRFGVGETNAAPPATNAEPFRIRDYQDTAAQLGATARQLTELLVTLDRTLASTNLAALSGQVGPVVQQAEATGKGLIDVAFRRCLLLVGALLVAALIYRFLAPRLAPAARAGSRPVS